jgi:hypothetical protein
MEDKMIWFMHIVALLMNSLFHSVHSDVSGVALFVTWDEGESAAQIQYILESNPHPFYSFRGLKNQMRIRFAG